jgi:hypothetical protein
MIIQVSSKRELQLNGEVFLHGHSSSFLFFSPTIVNSTGQMLSEKNVFFDIETGKLGQGAFGAVYKGMI